MRREKAERIKRAVGLSMEMLGKGLGRPIRQIAAIVFPPDQAHAYINDYRSRGDGIVIRAWGAEVYRS